MSRGEAEVIRSIRPLVPLDDEEFSFGVNRPQPKDYIEYLMTYANANITKRVLKELVP